tara:strand:+ start:1052 stop:1246 length:195 start_codon:yes stop_codon:yes gene_type:complete
MIDGSLCMRRVTSEPIPITPRKIKNLGHKDLITTLNSSLVNNLNNVGAIIALWIRMTPTAIPGK